MFSAQYRNVPCCSARPTRSLSRPSRRAFRAAGLNVRAIGRSGTDRSLPARVSKLASTAPRYERLRRPPLAITVGSPRAFAVPLAARSSRLFRVASRTRTDRLLFVLVILSAALTRRTRSRRFGNDGATPMEFWANRRSGKLSRPLASSVRRREQRRLTGAQHADSGC
jgi:hypothetical protein